MAWYPMARRQRKVNFKTMLFLKETKFRTFSRMKYFGLKNFMSINTKIVTRIYKRLLDEAKKV